MQDNAQTFWLENLQLADSYNQWIFSQIQPHLGQKVLEVGCGNGNFTVLLTQNCSKVVALDLDEEYVKATQSRLAGKIGVEILQFDATEMCRYKSFDSIIMLDVLEHIKDDVTMLRQLGDCLKIGGKLIIKVPALNCLYSPMDRAIGHYRRYHKKTLKRALQKAYFLKFSIWYFNGAGILGWWLNGKVFRRIAPSSEQVRWFNRLVPFLRISEALIKPPVGLSLFAVATKS